MRCWHQALTIITNDDNYISEGSSTKCRRQLLGMRETTLDFVLMPAVYLFNFINGFNC